MSNPTGSLISLEDVTEDLVIEYLCTHPEFFQHHEDLLDNLYIPHPIGPAVSLIERQVERLRKDNQNLKQEIINTLSIAKQNEKLFNTIKRLTILLMQTKNFDEVIKTLKTSLLNDFGVDFLRIGLVDVPKTMLPNQLVFNYHVKQDKTLNDLIRTDKPICQSLTKTQYKYLFGNISKQVASSAILPLGRQGEYGIIAIGSRDKHKFHKDMDTLFLDYLGKVVSELIDKYS